MMSGAFWSLKLWKLNSLYSRDFTDASEHPWCGKVDFPEPFSNAPAASRSADLGQGIKSKLPDLYYTNLQFPS